MRRGSIPVGPLVSRVKAKSSSYTLDRRDDSSSSGYEYDTDAAEVDLYLYDPSLSRSVEGDGESNDGTLQGLCLPDEDIEVYDRLSYGQGRYELVEPIDGVPDQHDPTLLALTFERVEENKSDSNFSI